MASPNFAPGNQSGAGDFLAATPDVPHANNYFEHLATELHFQIAGYLEDRDLKSLRAVCSSLARNTIDIFADNFFARVRRHRYVPSALKVLLEISSLPVFARRIEAIEIETPRLDSLMPLLPATVFSDMQQQLCSILKNLSKYCVCKQIGMTPGPRSTHHNVATNALCKVLIESKYPLQSLRCTFWGFQCPTYYEKTNLGRQPDECPFDLPAEHLDGLRQLLSSLSSIEISVRDCGDYREYYQDEDKLSCRWLLQALTLCTTLPELIISGHNGDWSAQARSQLRKLPLHTLTIKDMPNEQGTYFAESFISNVRDSLRHLKLSRVVGSSNGLSWQDLLPRMGRYLTLDSIKLEELVNVHQKLTSKPYSYESSAGSEQIRAHLLQIGNGEHDWAPREDQN